ncbi:hypothetical protein N7520_002321 [Penicillium odoratum]|uniref:uncharacterized protein n=1 Tax=Penicillium odoratum TaxID=1167516 RepID=UPI002547145F|nr:uncharacterized protein N7520_002321 [Penicillium odoratum]KAJ5771792.1 hypothetical protein N7520_002321 [Penicillium odoratum]
MDSLPYEISFSIFHESKRDDLLNFGLTSRHNLQLVVPILAGYRLLGALIRKRDVTKVLLSSLAIPHLDLFIQHDGKSIIHHAIQHGHHQVAEQLVSKAPRLLQTEDKRMRTPLVYAVIQRQYTLVKSFISKGVVLLNHQDDTGSTALHYAADFGSTVMVQHLLDANADDSLENSSRRTPLLLAVRGNHTSVAFQLIAHGADTRAHDEEHDALFWAVFHRNIILVRQLLDNGATPQGFVPASGDTILHRAIFYGYNVIWELVSRGANIHARNNAGNTPLELAYRYGGEPKVQMLERRL